MAFVVDVLIQDGQLVLGSLVVSKTALKSRGNTLWSEGVVLERSVAG